MEERRKYERYPIDLTAKYVVDLERRGGCRLVDLSEEGTRIMLDAQETFEKGTRVQLAIDFPLKVGPMPAVLNIRWIRQLKGGGKYTCADGEGTLDVTFSGLVPNGVYTMWHAFIALPPTTPFSGTLDIPLGARDGSTSVFEADADGNAAFQHTFQPCLELSDVWTTSMLAINWHSDGKTYGAYPGDFGLNAHIPLFLMLPPREGLE